MSFYLKYVRFSLIALLIPLLLLISGIYYPLYAEAESTSTVAFDLMKKFSGPVPLGYTADQFSFNISTIAEPVTLEAFSDDTATNVVNLPIGTYTISENGPTGFVPADWTVQWSGAGCVDQTGESTTIVIEERHLGLSNFGCRADNQWKPENNNEDDPDSDQAPTTGTLVVSKVIIGTTTVPVSNFSFTYTGAVGNLAFNPTGSNAMTVATGTYTVTEVPAVGYTTTYNNCSDIQILAGATSTTCVVTNTVNGDGGGGDGQSNDVRYLVYGYVWHDANESDVWEMDDPETEVVETNENDLDGWIVNITSGSTTYATTTDATGYYYFYVPAGTWVLHEVLQSGWQKTFPNVDGHTVTVIDESVAVTIPQENNLFRMIFAFVMPRVYAATLTEYGPYDFGNVMFGSGGGGDSSDDGNGGTSNGSSGGSRRNTTSSDGRGGDMNNPTPTPMVLGVATSTLPVGAPDTGSGGTSPLSPVLPSFLLAVTPTRAIRRGK